MPYITVHDHDIQKFVCEDYLNQGDGLNFCTMKISTKCGSTICIFFRPQDLASVQSAVLLLNNRPSVSKTTEENTDE